jgi:predicted small secreted protein
MRIFAFLLLLGTISLTACQDGPSEGIGENIDDAARDAGNAVEDVCEDVTNANC